MTFKSGKRREYRTEATQSYPVAGVRNYGDDIYYWDVYGRNGNDCIARGKHNDLTQAQIAAEKELKAWMEANG